MSGNESLETRRCRTNRGDKIDPTEIQIIHAISRTTRACWLFGDDPHSGKNFDHRKVWIEDLLKHFAATKVSWK